MKLVIVGPGRMGQAVHALAERDGHEIVHTVGRDGWERLDALHAAGSLAGVDAAIEFTRPEQVRDNVARLTRLGLPIVVGTTAWDEDFPAVRESVEAADGSLVHGSNFSIGVHVFDRVVGEAARLFRRVDGVAPYLVEHHHAAKVDAPSGTARHLVRTMRSADSPEIPVTSIRAGHEPGRHTIGFDGPFDHVTLTHAARSREGFAAGALLAAQLLQGRRGVHAFGDLMNDWLGEV